MLLEMDRFVACDRFAADAARLLDHVDRGEEADPDDIDEVPVVGHDDGCGCLLVSEPLGRVGTTEDNRKAMSPPVTCMPWKPVVR